MFFVLIVLFLHLSCLVFSEVPGSVVWCLTLIWGKFSVITASNILLFLYSPSGIPIMQMLHLIFSCPTVPGYSVLLFSVCVIFFFLLCFSVWEVSFFFLFFKFNFIYFLYSRFLLVIYFIHISVYVNQNLPFHPTTTTAPSTFPPWCPCVCLYICVSISALQTSSSVRFF